MLAFHTSHFIWIQKKQYRDDQRPYSPHWLLGALLSKPRLRGYRTDNRSSLCDGSWAEPRVIPQTSGPSSTQQVFSTCVDEGVCLVMITCTEGVVMLCTGIILRMILWVSPGLEQTCVNGPRIICRWVCWANWFSLRSSEWKSRISAGTHSSFHRCSCSLVNKMEGTNYICLFAVFFKPLRANKMVQGHRIYCSGTSGH